jgi:hypothetical protein
MLNEDLTLSIKKLQDSSPTDFRLWYNDWVLKQDKDLKVLDIGKSRYWDYSIFKDYTTIDTNGDVKPDILGNAEDYPFENYDLVLLNGMYECCDVGKVLENLKGKADKVMCGFVTKDYVPYKSDWKFYDGELSLFKDWNIEEIVEFVGYVFILLTKK